MFPKMVVHLWEGKGGEGALLPLGTPKLHPLHLPHVELEGLLAAGEWVGAQLMLEHVLAANHLILQGVFLVEVGLLVRFLKTSAQVTAKLALQVAGHALVLALHDPEGLTWVGGQSVLL